MYIHVHDVYSCLGLNHTKYFYLTGVQYMYMYNVAVLNVCSTVVYVHVCGTKPLFHSLYASVVLLLSLNEVSCCSSGAAG